MNYNEQLNQWRERRKEIYQKVLAGEKSQRQIAVEYGLSNTRVSQIIESETKRLDKIKQEEYNEVNG